MSSRWGRSILFPRPYVQPPSCSLPKVFPESKRYLRFTPGYTSQTPLPAPRFSVWPLPQTQMGAVTSQAGAVTKKLLFAWDGAVGSPRWTKSSLIPITQCYVGSLSLLSCSGLGILHGAKTHTPKEEDSAASLFLWLPSHTGVQVGSPSLHLLLSFLCVSYLQNFRSAILQLVFQATCSDVGSKLMEVPTTLQPYWNLSSAKF